MIVDEEVYLEHFGVKGMRWGVRRDPARQLDRANANSAMTGWGLKGHAAQKINKKRLKTEPDWSRYKYEKLPEEERKKFDRKVNRSAYSRSVARGAAEAGVILGGRKVLMSTVRLSPLHAEGLNQVSIFLIGMRGLMTLAEIKGIHDANKIDRLRKEVHGR